MGTVTGLTDDQGILIQSYQYDAFGNILFTQGDVTNLYQFSTKEYSSKSGLVYFGARYYDPRTGRWTQPDPLKMINGPNLYLYCFNNPMIYIDPWGFVVSPSGIWFGLLGGTNGTIFIGRHGAIGMVWSLDDPDVRAEIELHGWKIGGGAGGSGGVDFVIITGVTKFSDFAKIKSGCADWDLAIAGRWGAYLKGLRGIGKGMSFLEKHKIMRKAAETALKNRGVITGDRNVISIPVVGVGLQIWGGYKTTRVSVGKTYTGE